MSDATITKADERYTAHDWAEALSLYRNVEAADPASAAALALPLLIAQCRIELAEDPSRLAAVTYPVTDTERETKVVKLIRARALEHCRAGTTVHASELLRLIRGHDPAIGGAYRDIELPDGVPPAGDEPPFLRDFADVSIEGLKQRHRGKRVLILQRRFFAGHRLEPIHALVATAQRFGLEPLLFKPNTDDLGGVPSAVLQAIIDFAPAVVFYDEQLPFQLAKDGHALREQVEAVLAMARAQLGVQVVNAYMDAWLSTSEGTAPVFRGLGTTFDVINHCQPALIGVGTPEQNARTFCYGYPNIDFPPTGTPDSIPRACFAGSISTFNVARLAWWAETARRGLPVDFFESDHSNEAARSDQDYVNLFSHYQMSLALTRRANGPKMITGRTHEVPLAGGLLLDERSVDSNYLMTPNVHFVQFGTIDELARVIEELRADPARRARIRAAGRAWAVKYFTGDYFWAGLLHRLERAR